MVNYSNFFCIFPSLKYRAGPRNVDGHDPLNPHWVSFTGGWDERGRVAVVCERRTTTGQFPVTLATDSADSRERRRILYLYSFLPGSSNIPKSNKRLYQYRAVATGNRSYHSNSQLHHAARWAGLARPYAEMQKVPLCTAVFV